MTSIELLHPLLADWLQAQGYVERFGIGITRMKEAMAQSGLPQPILTNRADWFEVTLIGPGDSFLHNRDTALGESASRISASSPTQSASALPLWYK